MAKYTPTPLTSSYGSIAAINSNLTAIQTALENTLSRDGTTPNVMTAPLDMNNQAIVNASSVTATSITVGGVNLTDQVAAAESAASVATTQANIAIANTAFTSANAATTAANVATTNADVLLTHADVVATGVDRAAVESYSATTLVNAVHNAPAKTTPVDADEFGFWDSVGAVWNKITWANIKAKFVNITSSTGSAVIPKGAIADRDAAPDAGYFRYNTETTQFEGYSNGAWGTIGGSGGATGAGVGNAKDQIFMQTDQLVTDDWTIGQDTMLNGASINTTTDTITLTSHGFVNGQPIRVTADVYPTGVTASSLFYVINSATNTFQVSTTAGGSAFNFTDTGTNVKVGRVKDALITKELKVDTGKSVTVPTGASLVVVGAGTPDIGDLYVNTSSAQTVGGAKTFTGNNVHQGTNNFTVAPTLNGNDLTSIGIGQTWQNVTASRALSTNYTNTTGKPILIYVNYTSGANGYGVSCTINGIGMIGAENQLNLRSYVTFIIPVNGTYYIAPNSSVTIQIWAELR